MPVTSASRYAGGGGTYVGSRVEHDFREVEWNKGIVLLECVRCGARVVNPLPSELSGKEYRALIGIHEECEEYLVAEVMGS